MKIIPPKLFFLLVLLFPTYGMADGYFTGVFSNVARSQSAEATISLGTLKAELMGCFEVNKGHESICNKLSLTSSPNFIYEFVQTPQDGSQAWSIKASGNPIGNAALKDSDQIIFTSDETGTVTCQAIGQLSGAC